MNQNANQMIIVSYATSLPNILSVFNIVEGEIAHLQRLPIEQEHWRCYACDNMSSVEDACKHVKWAYEAGIPLVRFSGGNVYFHPRTEVLKPCPFCGYATPMIKSNGIGDYYVLCHGGEQHDEGCGARSSDIRCETEMSAVRRWNARA